MSCCSGAKQTRTLTVVVSFRPSAQENYNITLTATGSAGRWTGQGQLDIDFGQGNSCGAKLLAGVLRLAVRADLTCGDGANPVIGGHLDVTVPGTTARYHLRSIPLACVAGGPVCSAEWDYVFLGQYFGGASISVSGK